MTIGIAGLGLIGGSLAKSIKARTGHRVLGIDKNPDTMDKAVMTGSIDGTLDEASIGSCDLLLIALRPQTAVDYLAANAESIAKHAIVVDMCGVKRCVVNQMAPIAKAHGFRYIGGHPMAGKERGGFDNSTKTLFQNASMILTPDESTDMELLETLKNFFLEIGFKNLTFSTPQEHDENIAFTSQLAHVVSNAFVKSPTALLHSGFSAGSYKDLTRVARLDEDMWTELFLDNADNLTVELTRLLDNLAPYLAALKAKDADALRSLLRDGREQKARAK